MKCQCLMPLSLIYAHVACLIWEMPLSHVTLFLEALSHVNKLKSIISTKMWCFRVHVCNVVFFCCCFFIEFSLPCHAFQTRHVCFSMHNSLNIVSIICNFSISLFMKCGGPPKGWVGGRGGGVLTPRTHPPPLWIRPYYEHTRGLFCRLLVFPA